MSQLIQMRSRIKTIETIKKITHAMRLISMSAHAHMKAQQEPLDFYLETLSSLIAKIHQTTPHWKHERLIPKQKIKNSLIIFIGSQKGLCGNFNTQLIKVLDDHSTIQMGTQQYIAIGKKAVDHAYLHYSEQLIHSFETISMKNVATISKQVTNIILSANPLYSSVTVVSNVFKSFFVQEPTLTTLIPFDPTQINGFAEQPREGYLWDEKKEDVLDKLSVSYVEAQLYYLLFQSLLSEHAARFVSMDSSTRNANNLLEDALVKYNKVRQTKITTEITELSGSF